MWLDWVEALEWSTAIRESSYGYTALLAGHVIGMCIFAGLVLMMDLRLVGIGNRGTPFSMLQRRLFPWQLFGMVLSAITGAVLVFQQPTRYYTNIFFWTKMLMMMLAGINALAFHQSTYHSVAKWDSAPVLPRTAMLAGVLSVVLWVMTVLTGRLIAYNWFTLR
jgi:hypothetical protein